MRLRISALFIVLALLALGAEARAQTPAPSSCPTVTVKCPDNPYAAGTPVRVSAEVAGGGEGLDLKYRWQVSAGTIVAGQGTTEITIDTSALAGNSVTATVEVDGPPAGCDRTESCTLPFSCGLPPPRRFDKYENLGEAEEDERLFYFGQQLQLEPGSQAYIFYFGPRGVEKRLGRVREILTSRFGIDPERITGVNAGRSEKFVAELWVRPTGAEEPEPSRY
jgi:hypothetical protein